MWRFVYWSDPSWDYISKVLKENTGAMCNSCSKLIIKTWERLHWWRPVSLLLTSNRFHILFYCFNWWLWTKEYWLGYDIRYIELVFLLLTLHTFSALIFFIDFEHIFFPQGFYVHFSSHQFVFMCNWIVLNFIEKLF